MTGNRDDCRDITPKYYQTFGALASLFWGGIRDVFRAEGVLLTLSRRAIASLAHASEPGRSCKYCFRACGTNGMGVAAGRCKIGLYRLNATGCGSSRERSPPIGP